MDETVPKPKREKAFSRSVFRTPKRLCDLNTETEPVAKAKRTSNMTDVMAEDSKMTQQETKAKKDSHLLLQPMLTTSLLQCKSCSIESRDKYQPREIHGGKILLHLVLCPVCQQANRKIRLINNFEILPHNLANYKPAEKLND